ncbi:phosphatidylserine decarboxylase, partial [Escherichia coli]|nr:phosphatidylserine decarboxylase [Escherichia coli]
MTGSGTTNHGLEATLLNDLKLSLQYMLPKLVLTRRA